MPRPTEQNRTPGEYECRLRQQYLKEVRLALRDRGEKWWCAHAGGWALQQRHANQADRALWTSETPGWKAAYGVRGYGCFRLRMFISGVLADGTKLSSSRAHCLLCGKKGGLLHVLQSCEKLMRAARVPILVATNGKCSCF